MILRVFISEFLVGGGAVISRSSASLSREGFAMWNAAVEDVSQIPGCRVVTTLHSRFENPVGAEVIRVDNEIQEAVVFQDLLSSVDAVLVIAPETGGVLAQRCRQVRLANVTSWNCSAAAIELCSDKLRLADHLSKHRVPTIATQLADLKVSPPDDQFPLVLKPIDGAGCCQTFLIADRDEWNDAVTRIRSEAATQEFIVQPWIAGRALSVGLVIGLDGRTIECLAVGEQRIEIGRQLRYTGGVVPAELAAVDISAIEKLALTAGRTIPGLAGYIGIDIILTPAGEPILVEINPRLTTSYVGYRQLYGTNLPARWLSSVADSPLEAFRRPIFAEV